MKKSFLVVLLAIGAIIPRQAFSCSCTETYASLCETIEQSRQYGASTFRGRVVEQLKDSVRVKIQEMLTGNTRLSEIFLRNGNGATCSISTDSFQEGDEFLMILPLEEGVKTYSGFQCLYNRSVLPIESGDVLYPAKNHSKPPMEINYRKLAEGAVCDAAGNIQARFQVYPNPSPGSIWIDSLPGAPSLESIQLFNAMGQQVPRLEQPPEYPARIDLSRLPGGVYFLVLWAEQRRGVIRIVRTGT